MSNERRHLRFLITSALLVGPALGCSGTEMETETATVEEPVVNTPVPIEVERDPTGNPGGPEPEPLEPPVQPEPEPEPETSADSTDESPEEESPSIAEVAEEQPPRPNLGRRPPEPPPENRPRINTPPLPSER